MINKLKKIALITGGSGGIGSNICKELAKKIIEFILLILNKKCRKNYQRNKT